MPQLTSISLADRTPVTPVTHVFTPSDLKSGVGFLVSNAGTPVGEKRLTLSMKKVGARYKGQVRLALPVVVNETINGVTAPRVVRTAYVDVAVMFDGTSTRQERIDAIGMIADSLDASQTAVMAALADLEGVY